MDECIHIGVILKTTNLIYGGARQGGKSALGCLWLIENCQSIHKLRWLMGLFKIKDIKRNDELKHVL